VLPGEEARGQVLRREKAAAVAVVIAQMRNSNYLNRNLSKK
jgi:hypothetical protein